MVEYFVRVDYYKFGEFSRFCETNSIKYNHISTDTGSSLLFTVEMTQQDAIALKLYMQIKIMEIENE